MVQYSSCVKDFWPKSNLRTVPAWAQCSSRAFKIHRCWNSLDFTSVLESEPETKEFMYKSLKDSPEAQAIIRVHSFQKLLYRVFFAFCCECRPKILQIVSELPLTRRVKIVSANNTQVNSISSSQTKIKKKKKSFLVVSTICLTISCERTYQKVRQKHWISIESPLASN